ncbi:MAG: tetratricopeptide repeat protein [Myxococcales bacterium]|nr:tetratricopeptide repeat protein [Myxococcales bacterium]
MVSRFYGIFQVLGVSVVLAGCQAHATPSLVRLVGGKIRPGEYVPPRAYEWYVRGELAFARGEYAVAMQDFQNTLRDGPEDPYVVGRIAECLASMHRYKAAERVVEEALGRYPYSEALWLVKAKLGERQNQLEDAIDAYIRAEETAPLGQEAALGMARLLRNHGQRLRADAILERYLERIGQPNAQAANAKLRAAMQAGDVDAASQAVTSLLDAAPARAMEIRALAKEAYADHAPALAARLLDSVSRGVADEVLRIEALVDAEQINRARAILAISPPERFGGMVSTAQLFLRTGQPLRAIELADAQLSARASDSEARFVRGLARLEQKQLTEAAQDFALVPPGSSDFVAARLRLAEVLKRQGAGPLALEVLARALSVSPSSLPLRHALGRLRLTHIGLDEALELFEDIADVLYLVERAELLELGGDRAAAQQTYVSVSPAQDTRLPESAQTRVRAERLWADHPQRSVKILRKYVEKAPEDLIATLRVIEMYTILGARAEAEKLVTRAEPWLNAAGLKSQLVQVRQ